MGLVGVYIYMGVMLLVLKECRCRQLDSTCAFAEMLYVTGEDWSGEVMEGFSCAFAK